MAEKTLTLIVQSYDLQPNNNYSFTPAAVLEKLLQDVPLRQEDLQRVLKFTVDGNLPIAHLNTLIENGADVNHTYAGVVKLLHRAWKNVQENAPHAKEIFNLLLEKGAFLTEKEQHFFKEVDPQFIAYYDKIAPKTPAANLSKPTY